MGRGEPVCVMADATDEAFDEGEFVATELGYCAEDVGGLLGNFGADAVTGEDCNLEAHHSSFSLLCDARRSDLSGWRSLRRS